MHKMLILLGTSALALAVLNDGAEARKRFYDINGQRYSYETTDPAQVAVARTRIEAANAADAARVKAEEEKARAPLVAVFGSPAQREAKQAQARLQQVLAETADAPSARREKWAGTVDRQAPQKAERAEETPAADKVKQTAEPEQDEAAPTVPTVAEVPPPVAEPLAAPDNAKKVKSISFDVETGIKTTIMADGSAEEEPFDSGVLAHLVPESGKSNSLTAFVEQLRKATPEDSTGSVAPAQAAPAPNSAPKPE